MAGPSDGAVFEPGGEGFLGQPAELGEHRSACEGRRLKRRILGGFGS
jgi:hypothetical protein